METMTRRNFISLATRMAAALGLSAGAIPAFAEGLQKLASGRAPVLWLQGQSCSGCSVSLLDSEPVGVDELITRYISLGFHQTLSAATGSQAVELVNRMIAGGGYVLVVEGAVPAGMPLACKFGAETFEDQLLRAARQAKAVIALGACAVSGGVPGAEHNPTGAVSVVSFLKGKGVMVPVISIPGCPAHPDWLVGTVVHVLQFGIPSLDTRGRPLAFFSRLVHDDCPRFADYERERFASHFGDKGCLFKLGCQGPLTHADCNERLWNGGTNSCIKAGAPCVGCAWEGFAAQANFPFFLKPRQDSSNRPAANKAGGSHT